MKPILITAILIASATMTAQAGYFDDKVFTSPVEYSVPYTNETCRITGINVDDAFTAITFEFTTGFLIGGEANYSVDYDTALVDPETGNRYPLLFTTGDMEKEPWKKRLAQSDTPYRFHLVFPSVPAGVKTVNLLLRPGLCLVWDCNDIHIGNVARGSVPGRTVTVNPTVKQTYPGVKILEMIPEDDLFMLVGVTASKDVSWRWDKLTAINPADGAEYPMDVVGMPYYNEERLYMREGTTDAAMFCIKGIPPTVAEINIFENGKTLIAEGLKLK